MRICPKCKILLPNDSFYKNPARKYNGGLSYSCKKCVSEYTKNPDNKKRSNTLRKERRHRLGISKNFRQDIKGKSRAKYIRNGKEYVLGWEQLRKEIYKRDNWTCQECKCKCLDDRYKATKRKIQCHHIDYNVGNNKHDNLITLCASCHAKTNFNRQDWANYFLTKKGD